VTFFIFNLVPKFFLGIIKHYKEELCNERNFNLVPKFFLGIIKHYKEELCNERNNPSTFQSGSLVFPGNHNVTKKNFVTRE